jgi:hypothetical protein
LSFSQSQVVTTRLRSTPEGRAGGVCGSSPLAIRSVQSPKKRKGAPPSSPASWFVICSPDWPDWTRRIQASAPVSKEPNAWGIVRVEAWPSWWQPMQPLLFIALSQRSRVTLAGTSLPPPNSEAAGIASMEYQEIAG